MDRHAKSICRLMRDIKSWDRFNNVQGPSGCCQASLSEQCSELLHHISAMKAGSKPAADILLAVQATLDACQVRCGAWVSRGHVFAKKALQGIWLKVLRIFQKDGL